MQHEQGGVAGAGRSPSAWSVHQAATDSVGMHKATFENSAGNNGNGTVSSARQGDHGAVARPIGQTCLWQSMPITGAELLEVAAQHAKGQPFDAQASNSTAAFSVHPIGSKEGAISTLRLEACVVAGLVELGTVLGDATVQRISQPPANSRTKCWSSKPSSARSHPPP
jgi:hypothetical protein